MCYFGDAPLAEAPVARVAALAQAPAQAPKKLTIEVPMVLGHQLGDTPLPSSLGIRKELPQGLLRLEQELEKVASASRDLPRATPMLARCTVNHLPTNSVVDFTLRLAQDRVAGVTWAKPLDEQTKTCAEGVLRRLPTGAFHGASHAVSWRLQVVEDGGDRLLRLSFEPGR